jgi:hypothetical protein
LDAAGGQWHQSGQLHDHDDDDGRWQLIRHGHRDRGVFGLAVTRREITGFGLIAFIAGIVLFADQQRHADGSGEQRRWTLGFRTSLAQPGAERPIEIDLTGEWVSTIVAARSGEYDAALELTNLHVKSSSGSLPAGASEQLAARLAHPFWVTYRSDGALVEVHFLKDTSPSDRNLLQMIATETAFVRAAAGRPVWTVLERDGAGSYLALYEQQGLSTVVKRKLKYLDIDGVAGAPANGFQVAVEQSELRFSLGSDGEVLGMDGSERMRIRVPLGDQAQLACAMETHLSNLRKTRAPELIGSLERARPRVTSSPVASHGGDAEPLRARDDERLLDGQTTASLLVAAMSGDGDSLLPDRLTALFRQRPEAAAAAADRLRKSGPQKRVTDALGRAASPTAIQALGEIARDGAVRVEARVDALTTLLRVHAPGPAVLRIPSTLLDDPEPRVQSAARMIGGALARAGRAEHPAEADALDAALIQRYRRAQKVQERCDLMAALGNSIGPAALPVIQEALRDAQGAVRAAAARALRLAPGAEIDDLLSTAMTSDSDPDVRSSAILAARFRHPLSARLGEALLRTARMDTVDSLRSSAITLLRQNPDSSPHTAETLAWIAGNDPQPGVRRLATQALAWVAAETTR